MDFIKRLFTSTNKTEQRDYSGRYYHFAPSLYTFHDNGTVMVNEDTILNNSTIYACIRILSNSVASLPLSLYRKQPDGSRKPETSLGYDLLISDSPNPAMNGVELLSAMMFSLLIYNVAYAEIIRNEMGEPVEVWPITPQQLTLVETKSGELVYLFTNSAGKQKPIPYKDILRVTGVSKTSPASQIVPLAPVKYTVDTLGLALSADKYASTSLKNGTAIQGVLETPNVLSDEGYMRLKQDWEATYSGATNAGRTALLEDGVTFKPITVDSEKLQLLETRAFQVRDIARIFGVPTSMLSDPERQSFSSNEQQSLDFVTYTLRPWLVRLEKGFATAFLTPTQRKTVYFEFNTDALLRGDIATRYNAYQVGIQNGWLSADEVRIKENMAPIPGGVGNTYLLPLNMESASHKADREALSLEQLRNPQPNNGSIPVEKGNPSTAKVRAAIDMVIEDIYQRERVALGNIKEKADSVEDFRHKITVFANGHKKHIEQRLRPFIDNQLLEENFINIIFTKTLPLFRDALDNPNTTLEDLKNISHDR